MNGNQRLWDQLSWIKYIKIEFIFIFLWNYLQPEFIFRIVTRFNGLPQLTAMKIWIAACQQLSFIPY
ncbi:hypothetical protein SERRSCBI_23981 (plasmid) [Serratia sp. SCBI]|nr:hypothetical protein SERRSCBI_23981 [Serratia sp. SCBI]